MSIEFQLPNIGEGVDTADIAEILISEGDTIAADQIVMELETDKAVVELPCPHAGTIGQLMVAEGDTVSVGQGLFMIESTDSETDSPEPEQSAPAANKTEETTAGDEAPQPANESQQAVPESRSDEAQGDTFEFSLPNIGEGVDSADIAELHVGEGDPVESGQVVMELETEKAVVELPCPVAGKIGSLRVSAGDSVQVGQLLMTIEGVGVPDKAGSKTSGEQPVERTTHTEDTRSELAADSATRTATSDDNGDTPTNLIPRTPEIVRGEDNGQPPVPAAPSTRRLARQLGVNLRQVGGSGPGGRITQEDVQQYVKGRLTGDVSAAAGTGAMTVSAGGALAPPPLPDFSKHGPVEREKLNKLARTAAENLTVSWNVIPHVTQHDRADVTELEAARKKFTKGAGSDGPKVTMTAIVIKALATALQQNPKFNSSLDPETQEIVYKRYYNIGCAVDTPNGLLVPVVKNVDQKSIREVAGEIGELAAQARDRKLPMDAMQGATCTVTNLGGIGGVAFTPIVNYPEVCILGLARGQKELRLEAGELTERLMLPLSLSYDHRVINGADAARFLVSLGQMLSDPFQLLSAI